MKKMISALLAIFMAGAVLAACGGEGGSSAGGGSQGGEDLVVYSSLPDELLQAAVDGFEAQSGLTVTVVRDSADRLMAKISSGAGPKADVVLGAGAELVEQCGDFFQTYTTSEKDALDSRFTSQQGLWTGFTPMPVVIMYNKGLTESAPEGWESLTGSGLRGQVAFADPQYSGTSYTALYTMGQLLGEDFVETFASGLGSGLVEGISDVYNGVAEGRFAAGITLEDSVQKFLNAGYEEKVGIVYPAEGTPVAVETVAIVKNAANEKNAKAFVDYVVSAEFQGLIVEKFGMRTVRSDSIDPRFFEKKEDITFASCEPAQAVSQRTALLKQFEAAVSVQSIPTPPQNAGG